MDEEWEEDEEMMGDFEWPEAAANEEPRGSAVVSRMLPSEKLVPRSPQGKVSWK